MIGVIPSPSELEVGTGACRLAPGATVGGTASLAPMLARFAADVRADCGAVLTVGAAGPADIEVVLGDLDTPTSIAGTSPTGRDPLDECHRITVDERSVTVLARSAEGAFRGITTLRQLIAAAPVVGATRVLPACRITDAPSLAWRGLSLDVARTFWPVEQVRRVIDIAALYKLNVLHLHLTDDQGWRVEIASRPGLARIGGAGAMHDRPGGHYTHRQLADLIAYAADRFVTIVPEVDMPGHAGAAVRAHPELSAAAMVGGTWPATSVLDPDQPGVLELAADVIGEVAQLFPGPFLHIGGDEAFGMADEPYVRFVDEARRLVREAGKRPVGWQETARADVGPDDVVQHWLVLDPGVEALLGSGAPPAAAAGIPDAMLPLLREMVARSSADLDRALTRGAMVLMSPAASLYLDAPYAEPPTSADPGQVDMQRRLGLKAYPRRTVADSYASDPLGSMADHPDRVAGLEAAIWCETLATSDELEFMLLPRLPGAAEHAWSARRTAPWEAHRRSLAAHQPLWSRRAWQHFASSGVPWSAG